MKNIEYTKKILNDTKYELSEQIWHIFLNEKIYEKPMFLEIDIELRQQLDIELDIELFDVLLFK